MNDFKPIQPTDVAQLQKDNEELKRQRRILLLALFPPDPAAEFHPEAYHEVTLEEWLAEIKKPEP